MNFLNTNFLRKTSESGFFTLISLLVVGTIIIFGFYFYIDGFENRSKSNFNPTSLKSENPIDEANAVKDRLEERYR